MSAMEKVAWTELLVTLVTVLLVLCLYPWLGSAAASLFSLMALITVGAVFLRPRGAQVVVDERDRQIEKQAIKTAVTTAWMSLLVGLILLNMGSLYFHQTTIPAVYLHWLIWSQFALCYGTKGLVSVLAYRRPTHAA